MTFENNIESRTLWMQNDNIEENLDLKNDDSNKLNDINHLEVEYFFKYRKWCLILFYDIQWLVSMHIWLSFL